MGNREWGIGSRRRKRIHVSMCILFFFFSVFFLLSQESLSDEGEINTQEISPDETALEDFLLENFRPGDMQPGDIVWYRSNSSGMALELIPSRLGALRNEYALSVQIMYSRELPDILPDVIKPYYESFYRVELRVLYSQGKEHRRQWIFRDPRGMARLAASGSAAFFAGDNRHEIDYGEEDSGEEAVEEESRSGFIEIRDSEGIVVREFQFDEDLAEWEFRYFHRGSVMLRAETWFKEAPPGIISEEEKSSGDEEQAIDDEWEAFIETVSEPEERKDPVFVLAFTDQYRYTRSGSIRAIDRTIHAGAGDKLRVGFPGLGPGIATNLGLAIQSGSYTGSSFMDKNNSEGTTISYNMDNRGRVTSEVWKDEDGEAIGNLKNNWSGDRVESILWNSGDDERLIEFEYDKDGNLLVERNFRKGVLERLVTIQGNAETEEIYMDGRLVLRAHWENGLKISEERISSPRGGSR